MALSTPMVFSPLDNYGPLKPLEQIIEEGATASTFKFGLLRALTDWIIENPEFESEQDLDIPFGWIANKFLEYYWPLLIHEEPLPQMLRQRGRGNTRLERLFRNFVADSEQQPWIDGASGKRLQIPNNPYYWSHLQDHFLHNLSVPDRVLKLLLETRRIVLDQPARYLPNVGGEQKRIFEIHCGNLTGEEARRAAMKKSITSEMERAETLHDALHTDPAFIRIPFSLFVKLRDVRFCVHTSILTKWEMYIEDRADSRTWSEPTYMRLLKIHPGREPAIIKRYRDLYTELGLAHQCLLTGDTIRANWHVDHLIPWSRYPLNAFWNLVPAKQSINLEKSNKVLRMTPEIRSRYLIHLDACLSVKDPLIQADILRGFGRAQDKLSAKLVADRFESILYDVQRTTGLKTWPG